MLCIHTHIQSRYNVLCNSTTEPLKSQKTLPSKLMAFILFILGINTHLFAKGYEKERNIYIMNERRWKGSDWLQKPALYATTTICVYIYLCMSKWMKSTLYRTIKTEFNFQKVLSRSYYTHILYTCYVCTIGNTTAWEALLQIFYCSV